MGSCSGEETVHGEVTVLRNAAIVDGLTSGRDFAVQLKVLIQNSFRIDQAAGELVEKVLSSITAAISDLGYSDVTEIKQECNLTDVVGSPASSDNLGIEYNNSLLKKRKVLSSSKVVKDRRGGSRRRSSAYKCKTIVAKALDDGFTWRKYGQKMIFSSKHPRSYFRCTHKYDRGCPATRQVQKSEDDSNMYVITYMGDHTCKNNESNKLTSTFSEGPSVISFGSNSGTVEGTMDNTFINSSQFSPATKQDIVDDQEAVSSTTLSTPVSSELFTPVMDPFVRLPEDISSLPTSMDDDHLDMGFINDLNFDDELNCDDYLFHYPDVL